MTGREACIRQIYVRGLRDGAYDIRTAPSWLYGHAQPPQNVHSAAQSALNTRPAPHNVTFGVSHPLAVVQSVHCNPDTLGGQQPFPIPLAAAA